MNRSHLLRVVAGIGATAASLAITGAALAHTNVAESDPADGAIVDTPPAQVTVRFGQEAVPAPGQISDATLAVIDACGAQVDNRDSTVNMQDSSVTVTSGGGPAGRYEIHWFATAADGAIQSGVLDFDVKQGESCAKVVREDPGADVEAGLDVLRVQSKRTRRGGLVTIELAEAIRCAALSSKADERVSLGIDTDSDRDGEFLGAVTCRRGDWSVDLESASQEPTRALRAARPTPTALAVRIPSQVLVGHVDVWIETSSEAPACGSKDCFDRAPDLGLVRAY